MRVTVEVVDHNKKLLQRRDFVVSDESLVWGHVVEAARRLRETTGVRIRAINEDGGILVLTSAACALLLYSEASDAA